ncbi:MAG: hypothetical protein ACJAS1_005896 [Oleiphilaceae bacterium]|jgi:hypothetical protein
MNKLTQSILLIVLSALSPGSFAASTTVGDYVTVSAFLGGRTSENLKDTESDQTVKLSDNLSRALAVSWRYERNKEGELLFSNSKHNLKMEGEKNNSADIYFSYIQFGGRVLFTDDSPFSSSLGLGIGATFLKPDNSLYDDEIAFSGNITGGLRYALNQQWALRGDLRVYGTVLNSNSTLFCGDGQCMITVSGEIYVQTELMAGIEYKFF